MAQPAQAMEPSATPQNWKSTLKLPPKDARIRTEVTGLKEPLLIRGC